MMSLSGNLRVFEKRASPGNVHVLIAMADRKRSGGYSDDYDAKRPRS